MAKSPTQRPDAEPDTGSAPTDLRQLTSFQLRQLTNIYTKGSSSVYERRFGLTLNEWRCIALLQHSAGMSLNRLAEQAQFDRGLTSRIVTALEARGVLQRGTDEKDARGVVIALTETGRELVREVFPVAAQLNERLLSALTRAERAALPGIIDKLTHQARVMLDHEREESGKND
ncbi:MarR family winged helix-turn-helix transcriptional regulator [Paraburkholderia acidisoli]|uniref:MarR family transcriptional regulator n=1 Tax=Paraburkholderia acidisoli TaxID=2571748 RepID=A0A7Z2JFG9_9BURK|nr:MarR family winged helix-turn-helix transcriptional regulator [Paraburkholderia acidisoli]QGZ63427.1 MarR family transcriptional regulator [Paraburkholderia acidisoli]